jgi:hypothetical protein
MSKGLGKVDAFWIHHLPQSEVVFSSANSMNERFRPKVV